MDFEQLTSLLRGDSTTAIQTLPRGPVAVVDLSAWQENLQILTKHLDSRPGITARLATKSLRVPALIQRALATDSRFQGLMCYCAGEARRWWEQGVKDLLLAYPQASPRDYEAILGTSIRVVVDSVEGVKLWQEAAQKRWNSQASTGSIVPLEMIVDCDASLRLFGGRAHLGVRRSPVRSAEGLRPVLEQIARSPFTRPAGLMSYEAQVAGLGDRFTGMEGHPVHPKVWLQPILHGIRTFSVKRLLRQRQQLREGYFEVTGSNVPLFNGGGSGSFNWSVGDLALTEVTAGSALMGTHLFDHYSNIRFKPALYFACPVVRRSDSDWVTVLGGGYVSSGEPGWSKVPLPVYPRGLQLSSMEACGEVQSPLRDRSGKVRIGDWVWFRPAKAGELAERFNNYYLVTGSGRSLTLEEMKTYRGLGWDTL